MKMLLLPRMFVGILSCIALLASPLQAYAPSDTLAPHSKLEDKSFQAAFEGATDRGPRVFMASTFGDTLTVEDREQLERELGARTELDAAAFPADCRDIYLMAHDQGLRVARAGSNYAAKPNKILIRERDAYGVTIQNQFTITNEALHNLHTLPPEDPARVRLLRGIRKALRHEIAETLEFRNTSSPGHGTLDHERYAHVLGLIAELDLENAEAVPEQFIEKMDELIASPEIGKRERYIAATEAKIEEIRKNPFIRDDPVALFFAVNTARIIKAYLLNRSPSVNDQVMVWDIMEDLLHECLSAEKETALAPLAKNFQRIAREILAKKHLGLNENCDIRAIRSKLPDQPHLSGKPLSPKERQVIRDQVLMPYKTPEDIANAEDIAVRAVMEGVIKPVIVVNIRRTEPNDDLSYATFLRKISEQYNGNITFLLSIAEEPQFLHDFPHMYYPLYRVEKLFGKDFFDEHVRLQVMDGGSKTRWHILTLAERKAGLGTISGGLTMMESIIINELGCMVATPNYARDRIITQASDNVVRKTRVDVGKQLVGDLTDNDLMVPFGMEVELLKKGLGHFDVIKNILTRFGITYGFIADEKKTASYGEKEWFEFCNRVFRKIEEKKEMDRFMAEVALPLEGVIKDVIEGEKLEDLGMFAVEPDGKITWFGEKDKRYVLIKQAFFHHGKLSKNLFIVMTHKNFMREVFQFAESNPLPEGRMIIQAPVSLYSSTQGMRFLEAGKYKEAVKDWAAKCVKAGPWEDYLVARIRDLVPQLRASIDEPGVSDRVASAAKEIKKNEPDIADPDLQAAALRAVARAQVSDALVERLTAADSPFVKWFDFLRTRLDVHTRGAMMRGKWYDAGNIREYMKVVAEVYADAEDTGYFHGAKDRFLKGKADVTWPAGKEQNTVVLDNVRFEGKPKIVLEKDVKLINCVIKGSNGKSIHIRPGTVMINCVIDLDYGAIEYANEAGPYLLDGITFDEKHPFYEFSVPIDGALPPNRIAKKLVLYGDEALSVLRAKNTDGQEISFLTKTLISAEVKKEIYKLICDITSWNRLRAELRLPDVTMEEYYQYAVLGHCQAPAIRTLKEKAESGQVTEREVTVLPSGELATIRDMTLGDPDLVARLIHVYPILIYDEVASRYQGVTGKILTWEEFTSWVGKRAIPRSSGGYREIWYQYAHPVIMRLAGDAAFCRQNLFMALLQKFESMHPDIFEIIKSQDPTLKKLDLFASNVAGGRPFEKVNSHVDSIDFRTRISETHEASQVGAPKAAAAPIPERFKSIRVFTDTESVHPSFDAHENFYFGIRFMDKDGRLLDINDVDFQRFFKIELHVWANGKRRPLQVNLAPRNAESGQYEFIPDIGFGQRGYMRFVVDGAAIKDFLAGFDPGSTVELKVKPVINLPGEADQQWVNMVPRTAENPTQDFVLRILVNPSGPRASRLTQHIGSPVAEAA